MVFVIRALATDGDGAFLEDNKVSRRQFSSLCEVLQLEFLQQPAVLTASTDYDAALKRSQDRIPSVVASQYRPPTVSMPAGGATSVPNSPIASTLDAAPAQIPALTSLSGSAEASIQAHSRGQSQDTLLGTARPTAAASYTNPRRPGAPHSANYRTMELHSESGSPIRPSHSRSVSFNGVLRQQPSSVPVVPNTRNRYKGGLSLAMIVRARRLFRQRALSGSTAGNTTVNASASEHGGGDEEPKTCKERLWRSCAAGWQWSVRVCTRPRYTLLTSRDVQAVLVQREPAGLVARLDSTMKSRIWEYMAVTVFLINVVRKH